MKVYLVNLSGHTLYVKGSKGTSWSGTVKAQTVPAGSAQMYEVGVLDTPSGSGKNWGWIYLSVTSHWDPLLQLYVRNNSSGAVDYAVQYYDEGENTDGTTVLPSRAELYGDAIKLTVLPLQVSWMGKVRDATPDKMLHQITIPGTHDSGTCTLYALSRCQSMTIEEQLLCGVRYFDIRVDAGLANYPVVHGAVAGFTNYDLGKVARIFRRFVAATKETVVMQLNPDRGTWIRAGVEGFLGALTGLFGSRVMTLHEAFVLTIMEGFPGDHVSRAYLKPIRMGYGKIPTLTDLAGRMVLIRRYDHPHPDSATGGTAIDQFSTGAVYDATPWSMPSDKPNWDKASKFGWPDGGGGSKADNLGYLNVTTFPGSDYRNRHGLSFVGQDKYSIEDLTNVPGKTVMEVKFDLVKKYLEAARTGVLRDAWFLNFSSGSEWGKDPVNYAPTINAMLKHYFKTTPKPQASDNGRYGTVLMDFVDQELLDLVIGSN